MMPFDAATVRHQLVLRIEFTPPVLAFPVFRSDAQWLATLGQAIARSGCVPAENSQPLVMLRFRTPAAEGGGFAGPAEPIDGDLVAAVVRVLGERGWHTNADSVLIREEADDLAAPVLEVALYDIG
jgi:hypothetical protein